MNIIFICGSLEPGRNGVGDYVRRLAGELKRSGHEVAAIGFFDYAVDHLVDGEQLAGRSPVDVLRIPASWPVHRRLERARRWIAGRDPEWLSLQYVPFSFNRKGLHFGLAGELASLGAGRKWHCMFHEIWMGIEQRPPLVIRLKGFLQQHLVQQVEKELQPLVNHTSCSVYQGALARRRIRSAVLPLFSNIPSPATVARADSPQDNGYIQLVHFGSIHSESLSDSFAAELAATGEKQGLYISMVVIGNSGRETDTFTQAFERYGIPVTWYGEQAAEFIASIITGSTLGLSTSPADLGAKSGAVAAMRSFGLPVIHVAGPWQSEFAGNEEPLPGTVDYRPGNIEACLSLKRSAGYPTLSEVSLKFVEELSVHS